LFLLLRAVFLRLRTRTPGAWRLALEVLPVLLLVTLLTWEGLDSAASRVWFPSSPAVRAPAGQTTTLEYCSPGGHPLAMDLSEPQAQAVRPAPMVLFIHGGDGILGDRQFEGADAIYAEPLNALLQRGFVVGSIDYGLAPLFTIRDQVVAAKCAVRFLRVYANELGIDPLRIGVYGFSEGGYLVSMLGTAGPSAGFDRGQYLDQSSRVQAVVDVSGPTDFTNTSGSPAWFQLLGQSLTGGHRTLADRRAISSVTYVAPGDPPFLIINGTDDWQIPPHHAQELAQRLHNAGVSATLVLVQHDGHGLDAPTAGQIEQPSPAILVQMIANFFVRTLGGHR
jgi:acetyl esterase/lipase